MLNKIVMRKENLIMVSQFLETSKWGKKVIETLGSRPSPCRYGSIGQDG